MKSPVIGRELRWRRTDGPAEWTYVSLPVERTVTIPRPARGVGYEVEIRNLGQRGTSSSWVALSVTVATTNREGAAALPPVAVGNVASRWVSGTSVTYTATDTTADISVSAGTLQIADKQVAFGASSTQLTDGTAEEVRTVYLYYDDPRLLGGTRTLGVTSDPVASLASTGRILIAALTITFDVAGGTGGSGGGDIGGGGGGSGGAFPQDPL